MRYNALDYVEIHEYVEMRGFTFALGSRAGAAMLLWLDYVEMHEYVEMRGFTFALGGRAGAAMLLWAEYYSVIVLLL